MRRPARRRHTSGRKTTRGAVHFERPFRRCLPLIRFEGKLQRPEVVLEKRGWEREESGLFVNPRFIGSYDWELALRREGVLIQ